MRKAQRHRAWAQRNPDKARLNRGTRSAHRLTTFDESTMTGECPVCGTVGAVVKGRRRQDGTLGAMCAIRASQLWSSMDEAPQERCSTCSRAYLDAEGSCPRCEDQVQTNLNQGLAVIFAQQREAEWVDEAFAGELTYISNLTADDAYSIEGDTISNPALRVIGAGVPEGTSPKKFIEQWWAANAHLV